MLSDNQLPKTCETPNRPAMIATNSAKKVVIIFRPRCKLWSCPYCAHINKRLWTARVYHAGEIFIETEGNIQFVTLTSHEKLTARQSWYVFPKAWKKLHARAKRKDGNAQYVMIPEQHEDGRIHVHMLTTWALGEGWWKTNARQCGLGYMADEEIASTAGGCAFYVSKYIGKQLGDMAWPKGFRRVRTSRNFPKLQAPATLPDWRFQMLPQGDISEDATSVYFADMGYTVSIETAYGAWQLIRMLEHDGEDI